MDLDTEKVYNSLQEFLIVLIHAIFYARKIYPEETFSHVRHYDVGTWQNNHQGVRGWAEHAAKACVDALKVQSSTSPESAKKRAISFIVLEHNGPVERYVLDLAHFPLVTQKMDPISSSKLAQEYKASLVSLLMLSPPVKYSESPVDTSNPRTLSVVFQGDANVELDAQTTWIKAPSDSAQTRNGNTGPPTAGAAPSESGLSTVADLTPIRFSNVGAVAFSLYHQAH